MSDGSFRYGLSYISILLGYAENYYRRLLKSHRTKICPKKLKALLSKGFTAYQKTVKAPRQDKSGSSVAHTVSYEDFCILVEHEAEIGNTKAFAKNLIAIGYDPCPPCFATCQQACQQKRSP